MKSLYLFVYGVSVGMAIAWVLAVLLLDNALDARWFAIGAAVTGGIGLTLQQRSNRLEKGRRWRRT